MLYVVGCSVASPPLRPCSNITDLTDQRSADEGRRHAAETGTHRRSSDADVANFGRKEFVGEDVENGVGDADERLTEHRTDDRRRLVA